MKASDFNGPHQAKLPPHPNTLGSRQLVGPGPSAPSHWAQPSFPSLFPQYKELPKNQAVLWFRWEQRSQKALDNTTLTSKKGGGDPELRIRKGRQR